MGIGGDRKAKGGVRRAEAVKRQGREGRLAAANRIMIAILENTPVMVALLDRRFRFIWVNQAYARPTGHPPAFFPGWNHFELYPHEENQRIFQEVLETGRPFFAEAKPFVHPDLPGQDPTYWDWSLTPVRSGAGRVSHLVLTLTEVTERVRLTEARILSEEKYAKTFQSNPAGIYLTRMRDGLIVEANEMMLRLFGYTREELVGRTTLDLAFWKDPGERQGLLEILRARGRLVNQESWMRTRSGTFRLFHHSAELIQMQGEPCIISTLIDLTEQRRLEEAQRALEERLRQAERMESIGRLAGGMAHELNNQLGVLLGHAELLLQTVSGGSPQGRSAEAILRSGLYAAAMIDDLLMMARRGVVLRETVDLGGIVADHLESPEIVQLLSGRRDVRLTVDCPPDLPPVEASPAHVQRILTNLVRNALDAVNGAGGTSVQVRKARLDHPLAGYETIPPGDYVVLAVSDTGKALPPEALPRLFEPFYTGQVLRRGGSGLGLAAVWGMVKDHDGFVDLATGSGGTTLSLYLPAVQRRGAAAPPSPRKAGKGRGERILIVDDEEGQRELLVTLLEGLGYRPAAAASGEEALRRLEESGADLLILDMVLGPGMDGLDTYRAILARRPGQRAIVVSGHAETDRTRAMQTLGAAAFLRKPCPLERLAQAVREALDRKGTPEKSRVCPERDDRG